MCHIRPKGFNFPTPMTTSSNGFELAAVSERVSERRRAGDRIVHCHGVYDLMHIGHVRHLEAARREGDFLVVTITPDRFVNKGPDRPAFNEVLRAEMLSALGCVDAVAINEWPTAVEAIQLLKPDVYIKGKEYENPENDITAKIRDEAEAVQSVGGKIHFTDEITFSSSKLLNSHFPIYSNEAASFLAEMRRRYSADDVVERLKSLRSLKVLVIGDTIIDEYVFCRPYGMGSKSAAIAAQFIRTEQYAGGALAIANHLAGFCDRVDLVSSLGATDSREEFIAGHLKKNISAKWFMRSDGPTIVKRRYVSHFMATKLFEISDFNAAPVTGALAAEVVAHLEQTLSQYDLVVVGDFGHGFMSSEIRNTLSANSPFLAVNAQLNSINTGYNFVTQYRKCDYVCIDEEEARMAMRDRYGPLEDIVLGLHKALGCQIVTVTRGVHGSLTYTDKDGFVAAPILSGQVVDTIGAGDAFLSITAACASRHFPPDLIGLIGNAVGALAVRIMGNKESVEFPALGKFLTSMLR